MISELLLAASVSTGLCVDAATTRKALEAEHGKWVVLSHDQLEFLRGIYAMNPATPPGLPFGDKAVLLTAPGRDSGLVFFIDGAKACTPMQAPKELRSMLDDIASGKAHHEGSAL